MKHTDENTVPAVEVLTVTEVARYLRVHPSTLYRMLKARTIPAFRVCSEWRFSRSRIDAWRMAQEQGSAAAPGSAAVGAVRKSAHGVQPL